MPVLVRYVLLQTPGWTIASVLGYVAWSSWGLPGALALAAIAFWIAKDFALYPFVRAAYVVAPSELIGHELLVGSEGEAEGPLEPSGHVRLRGERWKAESIERVAPGARIRVLRVRGLTVDVEPVRDVDDA